LQKALKMSTKIVKPTKEKSWALPGVKLTHEEFVAKVRKAEEGPFYTIEEAKERLKQWKKDRGF
jgi:two-component SAPR family response regulator